MLSDPNNEVLELQRVTRDVIAISSLPSIWVHYTASQVAGSLAEMLFRSLFLDFVCVYLSNSHEKNLAAYGSMGPLHPSSLKNLNSFIESSLSSRAFSSGSGVIPNPFNGKEMEVNITPIGHNFKNGVLVTSAPRTNFPTESDRLILNIASNQTNVVVEHKWAELEALKAKKLAEENANALNTERRKLQNLITASTTGISLLRGEDLVFELVNDKFKELVSDREYIGKRWEEVYCELPSSPFPEIMREVFRTGKPYFAYSEEIPIIYDNGKIQTRYYDFSYMQAVNGTGEPYGIYFQCTDVTDQFLAKQALEENSQRLADTITQLEIEKELRERFVATLTHDLRTPLTAAKMSAQILLRKTHDAKTVQTLAVRIEKNMDRSDNMIQDLLDANRIKAGEGIPIALQPCNFVSLVQDSMRDLELLYGDRFKLKIACEESLGTCDVAAMERVVENLASNAVKYGSPDTPVTLTISNPKKHWINLSVHNDGNPITVEDQQTLFSQYRRTVSADSSGKKGWGIGLTLVKGITEAHGGNVSVESVPGNGTLFTVQLPLNEKELSSWTKPL